MAKADDYAAEFNKKTDDAVENLLSGYGSWFSPFWDEEIHLARHAKEVILAKAFRRLSDGMQGQGQEGRTRQAPSDAIDG